MAHGALTLTEFNRQVNIAIMYLAANNVRLLFPKASLDELIAFLAEWNKLWEITENKATRNSVSIQKRDTLRKAFQKAYQLMQQSLKHSADVVLTDEDFANLFITKPSEHHSKNPPITVIPTTDITNRQKREIGFEISNPSLPDLNYKGLGSNIDSILLVGSIRSVGDAAPSDAEYSPYASEKKANITINFKAEDERKVFYYKVAFVNASGIGPFSDSASVVIPD